MKVWILEKWVDRNGIEDILDGLQDLRSQDSKLEESLEKPIKKLMDKLSKPEYEGEWYGQIGKSNYKYFCNEAADFIRRHKKDKYTLRVVKAEIEDTSDTWIGYTNPQENVGVLKYLYVQARY